MKINVSLSMPSAVKTATFANGVLTYQTLLEESIAKVHDGTGKDTGFSVRVASINRTPKYNGRTVQVDLVEKDAVGNKTRQVLGKCRISTTAEGPILQFIGVRRGLDIQHLVNLGKIELTPL